MFPTYQSLAITLTPYVYDKNAPYDSLIATSSLVDLTPTTVVEDSVRKDITKSDMPRTLVIFYAEDKKGYLLMSFVGKKTPTLGCCTLLFDPPLPRLVRVPEPGSRSFTEFFDLLKDFDLLKFGTAYYEEDMSDIDRAFKARDASRAPPSTPVGFKNMELVQSKFGKHIWVAFDQFFHSNLAQTAAALLRRADPDEVELYRQEIELALSTNKRPRTI